MNPTKPRNSNRLAASILAASILLSAGGCDMEGLSGIKAAMKAVTPTIAATGVSLNKPSTAMLVGGTEQLAATIAPADAINQGLAWSSDADDVATVSPTGLVSGIAPGLATITVTTKDGGYSASCAVAVAKTAVAVAGVRLSETGASLKIGNTLQLSAAIEPSDATNQRLSWNTSDEAVVGVSSTGLVTALVVGSASVYVVTADGARIASCAITVPPIPVSGVGLDAEAASLEVGDVRQLVASLAPEDATDQALSWSSSASSVASVSPLGLVTGLAAGKALITATSADGGYTATCAFTVASVPVTGLSLNKSSTAMLVGKTEGLSATIAPAKATNKGLSWSSSAPAVAAVSGTGFVSSLAEGSAVITVTSADGGHTASCTILVTNTPVAVSGLSLSASSASLAVGGTKQLAASIAPASATNQNVSWSSSAASVASVSATGLVTAIGAGSATITAASDDGGYSAGCAVTVTVPVKGISLSASSASLLIGGTKQLVASIEPANASNRGLSWSTSAAAVARVSSTGFVTGIAVGSAVITATSAEGAYAASCAVSVIVPVSGIDISASSASLVPGGTKQLSAAISPSNASNQGVAWSTSSSSVATVSSTGLVTGVGPGGATITATSLEGGFAASCAVYVTMPVTGVSLSASSASLAVGATAQLVASIAPSNATNQGLSWRTSAAGVATVSAAGLVTGLANGSAVITVTTASGGYTASCAISVVIPLAGISLANTSATVARSTWVALDLVFSPSDATNRNIAWSSADPSIAAVNSAGIVTGTGWGSTTITATAEDGGFAASAAVTVKGLVSALAGGSYSGSLDGTGSAARFNSPNQMASDGTFLYVVDSYNHMIRKVAVSTGAVTTLAGSTSSGSADGTGAAAGFRFPEGIALAGAYLYVADTGNNMIRRLDPATGAVTSFAGSTTAGSADGTGTAAGFSGPVALASDGTNLYVSDKGNNTIRKIVISTKAVTTLAGSVGTPGCADGSGTSARFSNSYGLATDGTNLYVVEISYSLIRKIVIATAEVTTLAGSGSKGYSDGIGTAATFNWPYGVATDGTYLYVTDGSNHAIRRMNLSTRAVTTLAGSGGSGYVDGIGVDAKFNFPYGIVIVGADLYIADRNNNIIRRIR